MSASYIAFYAILKIIGLIIGGMLLWFDIDQYNPTLQNFCTGANKKINCNSVLNSKRSKLFKDTLSLSELSFAYFFSTFLVLIIASFSFASLSILGFLSFASLPVIAASLSYQAIIKQWCKFCIIIQAVLVSEIAIAFFWKLLYVQYTVGAHPTISNIIFSSIISLETYQAIT